MNLEDYIDKFWYAERYFNVFKLEEISWRNVDYTDFKAFLNIRCFVYPITFMSLHNLFTLHYAFNE
jgi:hypothetical protein